MDRRRTDQLPAAPAFPGDAIGRAQRACELLAGVGLDATCGLLVPDDASRPTQLVAGAGSIDQVGDVARGLADQVARSGRALATAEAHDPLLEVTWRFAALPCGGSFGVEVVVVVADPTLTRREAEALAAWLAAPADHRAVRLGGPTAQFARDLAARFDADVVAVALFQNVGLLLNLHVRSGALLRAWRAPAETIWGEAAGAGSAMVVGDLGSHLGAESIAALGMSNAAIVGIENGKGVAIGAVGVAKRGGLDVDIARMLLGRSGELGAEVMRLRSDTPVPQLADDGTIDLRLLARRVGCERFSCWRTGPSGTPELVSAHGPLGGMVIGAPDADEEELVLLAAHRGVPLAGDGAAVIPVGDVVLYARDPRRTALERLRLALQDLRDSPWGDAQRAA